MTESLNLHYLNSDFDLGLRPRPRQLVTPNLVRQVRELSVQAMIGAEDGDAAWVRADVPSDFTDYLAASGVPVPQLLQHPRIDPARRLRPFGWSLEAMELNERSTRPAPHPPLSVVRRVNSRSFALELEADLFPDDSQGRLIESAAELETFLRNAPANSEWMIKAEHGHAGLANRRLRDTRLSMADLNFVNRRLEEDDRLIVEPWRTRLRDRGIVFDVPFDAAGLRIHDAACTNGGAFIGSLFDPEPQPDLPLQALLEAAERIAERLTKEKYFGPVCVDTFDWSNGQRTRLRHLVDLNARRSMSDGAYRLWRQLAPEQTMFYRFFNRRKLTALPDDLSQTIAALGRHRYDPSARHGILLASPLRLGLDGEDRAPGKLAVIFVGSRRPDVLALERWFRDEFEV